MAYRKAGKPCVSESAKARAGERFGGTGGPQCIRGAGQTGDGGNPSAAAHRRCTGTAAAGAWLRGSAPPHGMLRYFQYARYRKCGIHGGVCGWQAEERPVSAIQDKNGRRCQRLRQPERSADAEIPPRSGGAERRDGSGGRQVQCVS